MLHCQVFLPTVVNGAQPNEVLKAAALKVLDQVYKEHEGMVTYAVHECAACENAPVVLMPAIHWNTGEDSKAFTDPILMGECLEIADEISKAFRNSTRKEVVIYPVTRSF